MHTEAKKLFKEMLLEIWASLNITAGLRFSAELNITFNLKTVSVSLR